MVGYVLWSPRSLEIESVSAWPQFHLCSPKACRDLATLYSVPTNSDSLARHVSFFLFGQFGSQNILAAPGCPEGDLEYTHRGRYVFPVRGTSKVYRLLDMSSQIRTSGHVATWRWGGYKSLAMTPRSSSYAVYVSTIRSSKTPKTICMRKSCSSCPFCFSRHDFVVRGVSMLILVLSFNVLHNRQMNIRVF
jgi:hypothetical protein